MGLHSEMNFFRNILCSNGFSKLFIDTYIGKQFDKILNPIPQKVKVNTAVMYFPITYLGKRSFKIKNRLTQLIKEFYPQIAVRVVFRPHKTIQNFFKFKDKVPNDLRSLIVYEYSCGCCNATYIGKSKRNFLVRIHEHLGISIRTNRRLGSPSFSAIRQHSEETDHPINRDSFSILSGRSTDMELGIVETLYIKKKKPSLCNNERSVELLCF